MYAPRHFKILTFPLSMVVESGYNLNIEYPDGYYVRQQDNPEFRQIRRITGKEWESDRRISEMLFIEMGKHGKDEEVVTKIVEEGFLFNRQLWLTSERSGSMKRNGFLSFVRSDIEIKLNEALTMGIDTNREVVFSKYTSYGGLFLSSGHAVEGGRQDG